jgi:ribosomal protein L12E/L44/L45/RPP1/RPP2
VLERVREHRAQVERARIERHAARLDARQVEEVADERVDRLAALADAGQDVGRDLAGRRLRVRQHLGVAEDHR